MHFVNISYFKVQCTDPMNAISSRSAKADVCEQLLFSLGWADRMND